MIQLFRILLFTLICLNGGYLFAQKKTRFGKRSEYTLTRKDYRHIEKYFITVKDLGNDTVSIKGATLNLAHGGYVSLRGGKSAFTENGTFEFFLSLTELKKGATILEISLDDFDETNFVITDFNLNSTISPDMYHNGIFDPECSSVIIRSKTELSWEQQIEILNCICLKNENCYEPKMIVIKYVL